MDMPGIRLLNRQKALLAFLHLLGDACSRLYLMKSMFLLCKEELQEDLYDFHPYKRGPFSLCLYSDMRYLNQGGHIALDEKRVQLAKSVSQETVESLEPSVLQGLASLLQKHKQHSDTWLIRYIYAKYPYFAINNPDCRMRYTFADPRLDPAKQAPVIFTIGYEGKTIDAFLNQLVENNVHILADIRNNPVSMKYGFTGTKLLDYCAVRGIEYAGIPELGIPSAHRHVLNTMQDYERLFRMYRTNILPRSDRALRYLSDMLKRKKRIALMCFEKDLQCCHRNDAAAHLAAFCKHKYALSHV